MQPAGELSYPFGLALFTVASQKPSCQVSHREIGLQRPERIVAETEKRTPALHRLCSANSKHRLLHQRPICMLPVLNYSGIQGATPNA